MPDITTQVLNVTVRTTNNGRTVYDVSTADGATRSTWEGNLANQLQGYVMQGPVTLRVRQKPSRDGQRMFEDITAFAPAGQQLPPEVGQQQAFGQQGFQQAAPMQPTFQPTPPPAPKGQFDEATTTRITKLASLNYASILVAALFQGAGPEGAVEATNLVLRTAEIFYKKARSHENPPVSLSDPLAGFRDQAAYSQGLTGAQIASNTPGVQLGAPLQVDVDDNGEGDDVAGKDSGWD